MSRSFERDLWASRPVILVALVTDVVLALAAYWIAVVDVFHRFAVLARGRRPPPHRPQP